MLNQIRFLQLNLIIIKLKAKSRKDNIGQFFLKKCYTHRFRLLLIILLEEFSLLAGMKSMVFSWLFKAGAIHPQPARSLFGDVGPGKQGFSPK